MTLRRVLYLSALSLGFLSLPLAAQEARGTLLGRVTDSTDALIVGAKVDAQNVDTGVRFSSLTNRTGDYIFPLLVPGTYSVKVEHPGFKTYARSGIVVRVNDQVAINVALEVGQTNQTVEVKAETPLLDTSSASMGQVIESRTINELPLKDGMVVTMATLSPGVIFTPESAGYVRPFDTSSPSTMSIDGTRSGSNQFMMDGAPNMQGTQIAYSPPPGVVEEFKVQTATFDASSGFMGGASINMSLKSGANTPHGQVYYFMQNPVFTANKYFRLAAGKPQFRLYRWGGNMSGPVVIPKLYNGHNRTFFMYGYEGIWSFDPSPWVVEAVPTAAMRAGDFSSLLALGSRYQIYDPFSIQPAGNGRFSRQPVPNNIIPANRINPAAAKIAALWDAPNQAGTVDGTNNYTKGKNAQDTYWNHIVRIDHNVSEKQRFYVRTNFTNLQRPENIRHNLAVGDNFFRYNKGFAFDDVYTISPRFFVNTRYTLTRFITGNDTYQEDFDLAGLGFSPTYVNQINAVDPRYYKLPNINVTGYSSLGGVSPRNSVATDIHEAAVNFTSMIGAHALRYGFAYRVYRRNNFNLGNSAGTFNFDSTWTRGPLDNSPGRADGPELRRVPVRPSRERQFHHQRFLRRPVEGACAIHPGRLEAEPQIHPEPRPALRAAHPGHRALQPQRPRLRRRCRKSDPGAGAGELRAESHSGTAGQPVQGARRPHLRRRQRPAARTLEIQPEPVHAAHRLRILHHSDDGAARRLRHLLRRARRGQRERESDRLHAVHRFGSIARQRTHLCREPDESLSRRIPAPPGASGGLATSLGQGITFFDPNTTSSYMQRWQFALQRQLVANTLIEVSYVGNRGTRMQVTRDLNPTPAQYLSTSPFRDQAAIDFLNAQVANPVLSAAAQNQSGVRHRGAFPIAQTVSAVQRREFRAKRGLLLVSLAAGPDREALLRRSERLAVLHLVEDHGGPFLSERDRHAPGRSDFQPGPHAPPGRHRDVRTAVRTRQAIPRSRRMPSSRRLSAAGRCRASTPRKSGAALGFGNAIFWATCTTFRCPRTSAPSIAGSTSMPASIATPPRQLASNIRTLPSRFSGVRADGPNNWDISFIKNTQIKEGTQLQFRAEAINALNHPQFTAPNTTPTSTAFGTVTGEFAWPRVIQFGLKLLF